MAPEDTQRIISSLTTGLTGESPLALAFGAFEENRMVALISAFRWQALPYYTIRDLRSANPTGSVRRYVHVFDALLTRVLTEMENEGRYDFYFANYQRNFHKSRFENEKRQRAIPHYFSRISRYELYVEEVLAPGEASKWPGFRTLLANRVFDIPVWIRRGSLKPEFRNQLLINA